MYMTGDDLDPVDNLDEQDIDITIRVFVYGT